MDLKYNTNPQESRVYQMMDNNTNISTAFKQHSEYLKFDADYIDYEDKYDYRPDLIAHYAYGDDQLFHAILYANGLTTIMEFSSEHLGDRIFIPKQETIDKILKHRRG